MGLTCWGILLRREVRLMAVSDAAQVVIAVVSLLTFVVLLIRLLAK